MNTSRCDFIQSAALFTTPPNRTHYDVAFYGGVPCGIAAAIAAARGGARVLLIEEMKAGMEPAFLTRLTSSPHSRGLPPGCRL